jgi:hypothetical protein
VFRLPGLVVGASIGGVASLEKKVAGVVVAHGESLESVDVGVLEIRDGSGVNIVRSIESRPVLLDFIAVSENQSSKFAQLSHRSSRSRWSSREYFR